MNLFVPHAFYYSVEGRRKEERPPDVGPHNIWWRYYRLFSDYMRRISYLMTDSVSLTRVAVLCDNNCVPAEEVAGLYERQIGFHYLPVAMLADGVVRESRLCIGSCRFDVVVDLYGYRMQESYAGYLDGVRIADRADVLYPENNKQEKFRKACRGKPERPVAEDEDYRTVITESDCPFLRAVHMEKEGVSWYLFSNEGEETVETNLFVKEIQDGKMPLWIDLWDVCAEESDCGAGDNVKQGISQDSRPYIRLKLEHCSMKLLLFLKEGENEVWVRFTGNAVNRYGTVKVPFGLGR